MLLTLPTGDPAFDTLVDNVTGLVAAFHAAETADPAAAGIVLNQLMRRLAAADPRTFPHGSRLLTALAPLGVDRVARVLDWVARHGADHHTWESLNLAFPYVTA